MRGHFNEFMIYSFSNEANFASGFGGPGFDSTSLAISSKRSKIGFLMRNSCIFNSDTMPTENDNSSQALFYETESLWLRKMKSSVFASIRMHLKFLEENSVKNLSLSKKNEYGRNLKTLLGGKRV